MTDPETVFDGAAAGDVKYVHFCLEANGDIIHAAHGAERSSLLHVAGNTGNEELAKVNVPSFLHRGGGGGGGTSRGGGGYLSARWWQRWCDCPRRILFWYSQAPETFGIKLMDIVSCCWRLGASTKDAFLLVL